MWAPRHMEAYVPSNEEVDAKLDMLLVRRSPSAALCTKSGTVKKSSKESFEDVIVWVKAELPCQRYGLFVDAVSLLDFFTCIGHVDAEKTFAAFHSQQRLGFSSMYGARVAASIQNLFPMVFGKSSSSGLDDSEFLPAIHDPDKWDNGSTGLKHQICRGMSDVEYQLESAIESVPAGLPEAKQIAKECLYKAKRFVSELCNFITNDFHKWKHRGHSKRDAW